MGNKLEKNEKVVLFIENSNYGRDFEINLPIMYFFEKVLKWRVEYKHIKNIPSILSVKCNLIIMSSISGALSYIEIAKFIKNSNIPLISNTTEGMFREKDIEEFVWGWNKSDKIIFEQMCNYWSTKSYNLVLKYYPKRKEISSMCGATGFDKYQIYKSNKINTLGYNKVIGYAAFDFNNIKSKKDLLVKEIGEEKFNQLMMKSVLINNILKVLIQNKDILFLLKAHPGDGNEIPLEFANILENENVHMLGQDISIVDAISNSDIWVNYNSSTNLEAWLLNKPTISFNMDNTKFSSDVLYGSLLEDNPNKINQYIYEFYKVGKIQNFEEKKELRNNLISNYIGFDDGLNHVRFMSSIKKFTDDKKKIKKRIVVPMKFKVYGYLRHLVYFITQFLNFKILSRYNSTYKSWNKKLFNKNKKQYYIDFDIFYDKNRNKINKIYNTYSSNCEMD